MFRLCSTSFSTVLELCFNHARGMFRPCSSMLRLCSRYRAIVLEASYDYGRGLLRQCLTVLDRPRSMFRICARPKPLSRLYNCLIKNCKWILSFLTEIREPKTETEFESFSTRKTRPYFSL